MTDNPHEVLRRHGIENPLEVLHETDRGTLWFLTCPGGQGAIDLWQALREIVSETMHWPVLLGSEEEIENHRETLADAIPTSELLEVAQQLDGENVLLEREQQQRDDMAEFGGDEGEPDPGPWPEDAEPNDSFTLPFDILTRKPLATVAIALIPTERSWEVPAFLNFGGFNDCPSPSEHIAVMKRWKQLFGAEVVGISHDVVEMRVTKPPTDRESALELAREQYAYCIDIVEQGTQTQSKLAASLINGSAWYFWWD